MAELLIPPAESSTETPEEGEIQRHEPSTTLPPAPIITTRAPIAISKTIQTTKNNSISKLLNSALPIAPKSIHSTRAPITMTIKSSAPTTGFISDSLGGSVIRMDPTSPKKSILALSSEMEEITPKSPTKVNVKGLAARNKGREVVTPVPTEEESVFEQSLVPKVTSIEKQIVKKSSIEEDRRNEQRRKEEADSRVSKQADYTDGLDPTQRELENYRDSKRSDPVDYSQSSTQKLKYNDEPIDHDSCRRSPHSRQLFSYDADEIRPRASDRVSRFDDDRDRTRRRVDERDERENRSGSRDSRSDSRRYERDYSSRRDRSRDRSRSRSPRRREARHDERKRSPSRRRNEDDYRSSGRIKSSRSSPRSSSRRRSRSPSRSSRDSRSRSPAPRDSTYSKNEGSYHRSSYPPKEYNKDATNPRPNHLLPPTPSISTSSLNLSDRNRPPISIQSFKPILSKPILSNGFKPIPPKPDIAPVAGRFGGPVAPQPAVILPLPTIIPSAQSSLPQKPTSTPAFVPVRLPTNPIIARLSESRISEGAPLQQSLSAMGSRVASPTSNKVTNHPTPATTPIPSINAPKNYLNPKKRSAAPSGHDGPATSLFFRSPVPSTSNLDMNLIPKKRKFIGVAKIGEYELQDKLGEGTFGVVWRAIKLSDKGKGKEKVPVYALKQIILHNENDGMPITSLREIRLLKALQHESVVPCSDIAFEEGDRNGFSLGKTYMVFPYMDHDLAGLLENRNVNLETPHIKQYAKQLLTGTAYLHSNGILHRDMKAANLLINNEGRLMIADFGLARSIDKLPHAREYTNCVVTRWYRPPELLIGERRYHTSVDLWGVGCVIAEMYKKTPIFPGASDIDQADRIFEICGSPNDENMPGWSQLSGCDGKVEWKFSSRKVKQEFGSNGIEYSDLIDQLLVLDPTKRLTAEQALNHEWFWKHPLPTEPKDMPTYAASHEFDRRKREELEHNAFGASKQQAQTIQLNNQLLQQQHQPQQQQQQRYPPQNNHHSNNNNQQQQQQQHQQQQQQYQQNGNGNGNFGNGRNQFNQHQQPNYSTPEVTRFSHQQQQPHFNHSAGSNNNNGNGNFNFRPQQQNYNSAPRPGPNPTSIPGTYQRKAYKPITSSVDGGTNIDFNSMINGNRNNGSNIPTGPSNRGRGIPPPPVVPRRQDTNMDDGGLPY